MLFRPAINNFEDIVESFTSSEDDDADSEDNILEEDQLSFQELVVIKFLIDRVIEANSDSDDEFSLMPHEMARKINLLLISRTDRGDIINMLYIPHHPLR